MLFLVLLLLSWLHPTIVPADPASTSLARLTAKAVTMSFHPTSHHGSPQYDDTELCIACCAFPEQSRSALLTHNLDEQRLPVHLTLSDPRHHRQGDPPGAQPDAFGG